MSSAESDGRAGAGALSPPQLEPPIPARRYRGAFRRLYWEELFLLLRRRRNEALLAVLAIVPVFVGVAVKLSTPRGGDGPQFIGQVTSNGLFLVFTALTVALPFFLPLVVGVVSGDCIAGEAGLGTLRYLLTLPIPRARLLTAKTLAVASFTAVSVLTVTLTGLLTGAILFGLRSVTLLSGETVSLGNGLVRTSGVTVYVIVAVFGLAAGGIFVSTLTENAIAAMAATIGIAIFSALLDAVPQLSGIHPVLLTDHWLGFGELLRSNINTTDLIHWSLLHLAYAATFLSLAYARLTTKDITS